MKRIAVCCAALLAAFSTEARAFCGFYVAKADARLFNRASQVVLVRHDDKTVLTMANDYQGDLKEFAIVIPVPTFIERDQIHVAEQKLIDHLDAYTAPRLVVESGDMQTGWPDQNMMPVVIRVQTATGDPIVGAPILGVFMQTITSTAFFPPVSIVQTLCACLATSILIFNPTS